MAEFIFGPFVLDSTHSRLTRDGTMVHLRPLVFRALRVLLEHRGASVDYDTMVEEAWEGTHVARHTIDVTVAEVRKHLGEYGRWIVHRPKVGYAFEVPGSDALVRQGWHYWNQRTRSGCAHAIGCFKRAIGECPSDFRAFEGLSASYLAMAIFGSESPLETYPRFLEAHEQAVLLDGLRPELRCNRAFGLGIFERRFADAEQELLQTLEERPALGATYVRLGLIYGARRCFEQAIDVLARGRAVDPLLPTLAAADVLVRCWQRDFDAAIALGRKYVELHPHLHVIRVNYGEALECAGRLEDALAEYQVASVIAPDLPWLRALEGACQARLRRTRDANAILEGLQVLRRSEYVDAHHMAVFFSAMGHTDEAVGELERALAENSAWLYAWPVDPKLDALRNDPRARGLMALSDSAERGI
jgi:DNA-binding winged helix-turn-helix (wHTH) protein/tetratricopeptide (TPR) repeat protein